MLRKLTIKNPGCQFCCYHLPKFRYQKQQTIESCTKNARRLYQNQVGKGQKRKWKWANCSYATEKNKNRLCSDFKVKTVLKKFEEKLVLMVRGAGNQLPPTFKRDIWWND